MRKSCCFVFSLQTGITLIFLMDFALLSCLFCIYGTNYMDGTQEIYSVDPEAILRGNLFTLMTDGLLIVLYSAKVYYGYKYLHKVYFLPKSDYSYLEEDGDLRWHTRRVKTMRIAFKNYFLASAVATIFIMFQTATLLFVVWKDIDNYYRYVLLVTNALVQCFFMFGPIKNHIRELDEQVTYRVKRFKKLSGRKKEKTDYYESVKQALNLN